MTESVSYPQTFEQYGSLASTDIQGLVHSYSNELATPISSSPEMVLSATGNTPISWNPSGSHSPMVDVTVTLEDGFRVSGRINLGMGPDAQGWMGLLGPPTDTLSGTLHLHGVDNLEIQDNLSAVYMHIMKIIIDLELMIGELLISRLVPTLRAGIQVFLFPHHRGDYHLRMNCCSLPYLHQMSWVIFVEIVLWVSCLCMF